MRSGTLLLLSLVVGGIGPPEQGSGRLGGPGVGDAVAGADAGDPYAGPFVAALIRMSRPLIGADEIAAVDRVLRSGALVQGAEVEAFEAEFSATVEGRPCVAVSSGTAALHVGLLAAGIGTGDEVIVPSFTFAATAHAVVACGAAPVFVDVDPSTFCMDPGAVEAAVSDRTAAVVPVHLFGHPADMVRLRRLAERHGLLVVEDACQAQGARHQGRPAGALGAVAAISFHPSKTMTTGEGGMLVCGDAAVASAARVWRNQGMNGVTGRPEVAGLNARMTEMAAAMGRVQLRRVPEFLDRRRGNATRWDGALPASLVPHRSPDVEPAHHQYTIRCADSARRADASRMLAALGVETRIYYETPLHLSPPYSSDGGPRRSMVHTEAAAETVLSVPVGPHLTDAEVDRIGEALSRL